MKINKCERTHRSKLKGETSEIFNPERLDELCNKYMKRKDNKIDEFLSSGPLRTETQREKRKRKKKMKHKMNICDRREINSLLANCELHKVDGVHKKKHKNKLHSLEEIENTTALDRIINRLNESNSPQDCAELDNNENHKFLSNVHLQVSTERKERNNEKIKHELDRRDSENYTLGLLDNCELYRPTADDVHRKKKNKSHKKKKKRHRLQEVENTVTLDRLSQSNSPQNCEKLNNEINISHSNFHSPADAEREKGRKVKKMKHNLDKLDLDNSKRSKVEDVHKKKKKKKKKSRDSLGEVGSKNTRDANAAASPNKCDGTVSKCEVILNRVSAEKKEPVRLFERENYKSHPLHTLVKLGRREIPKAVWQQVIAAGFQIRQGKWSKDEDDLLQRNWQAFITKNSIEISSLVGDGVGDAYLLLNEKALGENNKQLKNAIRKFKQDSDFHLCLARGIDRTLACVYRRAHMILDSSSCTGEYSSEEVQQLRKLHALHGNNWAQIATALGRQPHTVGSKWRELNFGNDKTFGSWSSSEQECLVSAVEAAMVEVYGEDASDLTNDDLYHNLPWNEISRKVGARSANQCRHHWYRSVIKSYNLFSHTHRKLQTLSST